MQILRKFSGLVDGLNDRIGLVIRWMALLMVIVVSLPAIKSKREEAFHDSD